MTTAPAPEGAPGEPAAQLAGDAGEVWAAMRSVYTAVLAHDPDAADTLLDPDVTIWDSAEVPLVRGLPALAALRARRPTSGPALRWLEASEPVVDVWGDVALLRHVLRVGLDGAPDEVVRNTSVWRRGADGRWRAVHNHEDVLPVGAAAG